MEVQVVKNVNRTTGNGMRLICACDGKPYYPSRPIAGLSMILLDFSEHRIHPEFHVRLPSSRLGPGFTSPASRRILTMSFQRIGLESMEC